jgi:dihydrofolate reductase
MNVSLIVAMADDQVIGRAGTLPWHLPADLARFRKITMGHALVMGRKTYESIGRPLPGRRTVVLTRQRDFAAPPTVIVAADIDQAVECVADDDEIFVVGGAEIYRQALPLARRMYVTRIHASVDGDVHFPDFDPRQWQLVVETRCQADDRKQLSYSFQVFDRVTTPGRSETP